MPDDKRYTAQITFGKHTTTWDAEGEALVDIKASALTEKDILEALEAFKGIIQQTVPPHSAVRVDGKKLYLYARKGQTVELPVRPATIFEINILEFNPAVDYPSIKLDIHCGSGTYIRSIAKELGDILGVGAYLSGLIRTAHGRFPIEQSIELNKLEELPFESWPLLNPLPFLPLPQIELSKEALQKVVYGQKLETEDYEGDFVKNKKVVLIYQQEVVAIATIEEKDRLNLGKVFRTDYFQEKLK
jgi:tRNA pseudouridine55 synthase